MTTWAIIPVKQLHESKRRLEHLLSAEERASLIGHFLNNLLIVLHALPDIGRVLIVTNDPLVKVLAERHGVELLVEGLPAGLNAAVRRGVALAASEGATAALVLPADLPFVRVEDIERMLQPLGKQDVPLMAICGDEVEDGTNALLLAPPDDFTFRYGPGSFRSHLVEATERGRVIKVINAPGLRFDLDTESDWLVYNGYLVQVADA